MPELLYADAHLAGDFANPQNALGFTASTWAGVLNQNTNYTSRWSLGDPANPLTAGAIQTVRVLARKGTNAGTPTVALNLYVAGVLVASRAAQNVTSTTGQVISVTYTSAEMSPPVNAEIEVVQVSAGGKPADRNSAQVAYIEWVADTSVAAPVLSVAGSLPVTVSMAGSLVVPSATIRSVAATLPTTIALAGSLSVPTASVPSVTAGLDTTVTLAGTVGAPSVAVSAVSAALPTTVALAGELEVPSSSVPEVAAGLAVDVDTAGTLVVPSASTQALSGQLSTTVSLGGELSTPPASVPSVTADLPVAVTLSGDVADVGAIPVSTVTATLDVVIGIDGSVARVTPSVRDLAATLATTVVLGGAVRDPDQPSGIPAALRERVVGIIHRHLHAGHDTCSDTPAVGTVPTETVRGTVP